MGSRRAQPRRRRRGLVLGLLAVVVSAGAVVAGIRLVPTGPGTPAASPSPSPTPVRDVDLTSLPIAREPFCSLLDDATLAAVIGGDPTGTAHYTNGDRVELAPGVTDVSHEYNCSFTGPSGTVARAWVFAAPVPRAQARALARRAAEERGCRAVESRPTFGRPSGTTVCSTAAGDTQVTMRGLFGDAWFSCQLTRPGNRDPDRSLHRTERWCVHAAETVAARS